MGIRDLLARRELGDVLYTFAAAVPGKEDDVRVFACVQKLNSLKSRSVDVEPDYDAHVEVLQGLNG